MFDYVTFVSLVFLVAGGFLLVRRISHPHANSVTHRASERQVLFVTMPRVILEKGSGLREDTPAGLLRVQAMRNELRLGDGAVRCIHRADITQFGWQAAASSRPPHLLIATDRSTFRVFCPRGSVKYFEDWRWLSERATVALGTVALDGGRFVLRLPTVGEYELGPRAAARYRDELAAGHQLYCVVTEPDAGRLHTLLVCHDDANAVRNHLGVETAGYRKQQRDGTLDWFSSER